MVVRDHPFDFGCPVLTRSGDQVPVREREGWRDVVERAVRPDPEVVEDRSDAYLLELNAILSNDPEAQIDNPVYVVPIR